jgi:hypothetical protein
MPISDILGVAQEIEYVSLVCVFLKRTKVVPGGDSSELNESRKGNIFRGIGPKQRPNYISSQPDSSTIQLLPILFPEPDVRAVLQPVQLVLAGLGRIDAL